MTHVLESLEVIMGELHFTEHLQKIAKIAIAHVELALGADEARRWEADVAKCVNDEGCVASRSERLREIYQGITARINAHLKEEGAVTHRLAQELQACTGIDIQHADTICVENLSGSSKQRALELALNLAARYLRAVEVIRMESKLLTHNREFSEKAKTAYVCALTELADLADSTKASLDAASREYLRCEIALRTANEKIVKLEKEASETSERVAQAVRDMQKSVYKKEDSDRPIWREIQQKPLACLERTVQALKRMPEDKTADGNAANCADCHALKAKVVELDQTLVALVKENSKLLDDKGGLLADRQRDKDEMESLAAQVAKLRTQNSTEKQKKRNK